MTNTTLLIALFILEVVAFGWLIWEAKLGREKREQIIQLEIENYLSKSSFLLARIGKFL